MDIDVVVGNFSLQSAGTAGFPPPGIVMGVAYSGSDVDGTTTVGGDTHFPVVGHPATWKQQAMDAIVRDAASRGWTIVRILFPDLSVLKP